MYEKKKKSAYTNVADNTIGKKRISQNNKKVTALLKNEKLCECQLMD